MKPWKRLRTALRPAAPESPVEVEPPPPVAEPPEPPADRVKRLVKAGKYEQALEELATALSADPDDVEAIKLAAQSKAGMGAISEGAILAARLSRRTHRPVDWSSARRMIGKLRETAEQWQPVVAAPRPIGTDTGRVLYLTTESRPFRHNGSCTRTHESLQALISAGRDVVAVTMPGFPGVLGVTDPPERNVVDDVTYRHLLPRADKLPERLAFDEYTDLSTQVLAGFVARERPAVLHVASGRRGFDTALAGNAVARWAGIPWVYEVRSFPETTWTQIRRYADQGEYHDRRFATENRMMRAADLVLTLSGPMRDNIAETRGIPPEKIRVVPDAVDADRFTPQPRSSELRARLGLENSTTIGYVSNGREGQAVLLKAIAALRAQGRNVTGLLVGEVKQRAQLEKLAADLEMTQSIVFTGSMPFDEMPAYYAQMDLFVGPLRDERPARIMSPMTVLEAMAMDIPVLVTDLPGLAEIAGDGVRAHSFRAGDAESLAAELARLVDAPQEMHRLMSTAREWVRRERSWSSVATALDDAYAEVLSLHVGESVKGGAAC